MSRELEWHAPEGLGSKRRRRWFRSASRRVASSWFTRQAVLIVAAYFAYFLVRGFTEGGATRAVTNATRVTDLERSLGFFWEPSWQASIVGSHFLMRVANSVYIYGHWPVIIGVAIWLALHRRSRYLLLRNAFLISGGIGLVFFAVFPTAPPRLVSNLEIVDTVAAHSNAYRVLQPPALTNQYAAVPSLHLGWNVLIGLFVFIETSRLLVRIAAVMLPIAMFMAVVMTGNHFIFDGIAGIVVALIGLGIAVLISRRGSVQAPEEEVLAS
jgi:PAP2 superfamily